MDSDHTDVAFYTCSALLVIKKTLQDLCLIDAG